MLDAVSGDEPAALRDCAILLLLSIYGVRSAELRRLGLDDIDWVHDRIVFLTVRAPHRPLTAVALHGVESHINPWDRRVFGPDYLVTDWVGKRNSPG